MEFSWVYLLLAGVTLVILELVRPKVEGQIRRFIVARSSSKGAIKGMARFIRPAATACVVMWLAAAAVYLVYYVAVQHDLGKLGLHLATDEANNYRLLYAIPFWAATVLSIAMVVGLVISCLRPNLTHLAQVARSARVVASCALVMFALGMNYWTEIKPFSEQPGSTSNWLPKYVITNDLVAAGVFDPLSNPALAVFATGEVEDQVPVSFDKLIRNSFELDSQFFRLTFPDGTDPVLEVGDSLLRMLALVTKLSNSGADDGTPVPLHATGRHKRDLWHDMRAKVYARITSAPASGGKSLELQTDEPAAFVAHLDGLEKLNRYQEKSLEEALRLFSRSVELDSTFIATHLRISHCYIVRVDRRFGSMDDWVGCLDSARSHLTIARQLDSTIVDHPLYNMLRGGYAYVLGCLHFAEYIRQSESVADYEFDQSLLMIAEAKMHEAREFLVQAIRQTDNWFKLSNNISLVYGHLALTKYYGNDLDSAAYYQELGERAAVESDLLFPFGDGPQALLAYLRSQRYWKLEPQNHDLIMSAESTLERIRNTPAGSPMPLRDTWVGQATFYLASLSCQGGDVAAAREYLCGIGANLMNISQVAVELRDFKLLWPVLKQAIAEQDMKVLCESGS